VSVNFFCGNRYYYAKNGSIATNLAQDGLQVGAHPICAQGQGQDQRSCDTGAFVPVTKIASCRRQITGLRPNLHTMVPRCACNPCIQGVLKVKVNVKGHVLRALLCWHEKRFFSQANGPIATKLAHDGLQVSVHIGCAQFQGQGQMSRDTGTFVLDLKSLFLRAKGLDCDQICIRWSPGQPASMMCSRSRSRSRDTGTCAGTKIAGKMLVCNQTCTR